MSEGYVSVNKRTWYDVCVECHRIVSPRHSCCPQCGSTQYKGTIVDTSGNIKQKPLEVMKRKEEPK